jgi:hypothetical protein
MTALEYLIEKILFEEEVFFDEEGEWMDTPRIRYMNAFGSGTDLTEHVKMAREIESKQLNTEQ